MIRKRIPRPFMAVLSVVLLAAVVPSALASQQPVIVRATTAERETVWREIVYAARLRPRSTVDQRAPANGIIDRISVPAGQTVNAGELLMTVRRNDPTDTFRPVPVESFHTGVIADVLVTPGREVRDGDAVTAVDSARDLTLSGRVTRTNQDVEIEKRTIVLSQVVAAAETEKEQLVRRIQRGVATLEVVRLNEALARTAVELAEVEFDRGLIDSLELRNAQLSLEQTQIDVLEEEFRIASALIDLEFALNARF